MPGCLDEARDEKSASVGRRCGIMNWGEPPIGAASEKLADLAYGLGRALPVKEAR